ncbi:hypothetical protein, partial [Nonomuraea sp. NPDC048916]|uniref:hypothetical protein n=1 Tax=Nonomuraea sp. NPDC048916 TaxID=3154232 RepID=UPI0033C7E07E
MTPTVLRDRRQGPAQDAGRPRGRLSPVAEHGRRHVFPRSRKRRWISDTTSTIANKTMPQVAA